MVFYVYSRQITAFSPYFAAFIRRRAPDNDNSPTGPRDDIVDVIYNHQGRLADDRGLWQQYAPIIRHEALRLQVRLPASVELEDLIQAGMIGLLAAIDSFDAAQGASFTTYARSRIRWGMLDELRERDWVPRSVRRNAREIAAAIQRLEQRLGASASEQQIADELGVSLTAYQTMLHETNCSQLFSLDELMAQEAQGTGPALPADTGQDPFKLLMAGGLRKRVKDEIGRLPEREQLLLNLYYQQELNLKEIGEVLGVGESRVSQLHSLAIKRLRARLQENA